MNVSWTHDVVVAEGESSNVGGSQALTDVVSAGRAGLAFIVLCFSFLWRLSGWIYRGRPTLAKCRDFRLLDAPQIACLAQVLLALHFSIFDVMWSRTECSDQLTRLVLESTSGSGLAARSLAMTARMKIRFATMEWLEQRSMMSADPTVTTTPIVQNDASTVAGSGTSVAAASKVVATVVNGQLTKLTYGGVTYVDTSDKTAPAYEEFNIVSTDLNGGNEKSDWSGSRISRRWDAATETLIDTYALVTVKWKIAVTDQDVTWNVSITNTTANRRITGYSLIPTLIKTGAPAKRIDESVNDGVNGLQAERWNDGQSSIFMINQDPGKAQTWRLWNMDGAQSKTNYMRVRLGTMKLNGLAVTYPFEKSYIIEPGQTDTAVLAIRFTPSSTPTSVAAADAIAKLRETQPFTLRWDDRRPLTMEMINSDSSASATIMRTSPFNAAAYQAAVLSRADKLSQLLADNDMQGVIVWDMESNDLNVLYVGDPRVIPTTNPAFDAIADQYFKKYTDKGLRVGMTLRASHFSIGADGKGHHSQPADMVSEMVSKIDYAVNRWGASVFYIDFPNMYDPRDFAKIAALRPNVLLIPETGMAAGSGYNSFSAPYTEADLQPQTPSYISDIYPDAFAAMRVRDLSVSLDVGLSALRRGDTIIVSTNQIAFLGKAIRDNKINLLKNPNARTDPQGKLQGSITPTPTESNRPSTTTGTSTSTGTTVPTIPLPGTPTRSTDNGTDTGSGTGSSSGTNTNSGTTTTPSITPQTTPTTSTPESTPTSSTETPTSSNPDTSTPETPTTQTPTTSTPTTSTPPTTTPSGKPILVNNWVVPPAPDLPAPQLITFNAAVAARVFRVTDAVRSTNIIPLVIPTAIPPSSSPYSLFSDERVTASLLAA